jgi:glycosyltransferase involved in cell wall biosynthesis
MWLHGGSNARNSGLSRYAFHLIDALLAQPAPLRLEVFAPADYEPPAAWTRNPSCVIHPVRLRGLLHRVFWEHAVAGSVAARLGVDIWFSAAQSIPLRGGVKRAVMIHDAIPVLFPQWHPRRTVAYYRFALGHACRNADLILANSRCTESDLVRLFHVDKTKVRVTPLGPGNNVPPRDPASVADTELASLGIPFTRYLLSLGNLDPRKNLSGLIHAFAMLRAGGTCQDLGLVIVGGRRPNFDDSVFGEVRELGLERAVHFAGYLPDEALPAVYARAELFVFPSFYEGFGLPVLEAMRLGAPVVCSVRSSLPEVGGDAVVTFDPSDPKAIAAAIRQGLGSLEGREAWIEQGMARAATFTWRRTAELTLAAFRELLEETPPAHGRVMT